MPWSIFAPVSQFLRRRIAANLPYNSVVCKELLGCDISTPEGAQKATKETVYVKCLP